MTSWVSRCALVVGLGACGQISSGEPLDLYVLAGQSNMSGWGVSSELDLPYSAPQPDVLYHVQGGGFGALRPSHIRFGPELSFGRTLGDAAPSTIAIVKHAVGSTSLADDWNPDTGELYRQLLDRVALGQDYWKAQGYETQIAGIVWVQGEADARVGAMANAYESNLKAFISTLRMDLNAPEAPFVMGQIRGSDFPFRDIVRAAQRNIDATVPGAYLVESDELTTFEGLHFDTLSQLELGRRYATAMHCARSSLAGDVTADGRVDLDDLNNVRTHFGGEGIGDANCDGLINLIDLNLVRDNFGATSSASVAEPPSDVTAMVVLALSSLAFRRRFLTSSTRNRANRLGLR